MLQVKTKNLGTVAILSLQGQIVNGEMEILRNAVQAVSGVRTVKLDFARVTTVDAGGLGLMLELRQQIESKGMRFELLNITGQIRRVFEITRLDSVFRITDGVEFFSTIAHRHTHKHALRLASCA